MLPVHIELPPIPPLLYVVVPVIYSCLDIPWYYLCSHLQECEMLWIFVCGIMHDVDFADQAV